MERYEIIKSKTGFSITSIVDYTEIFELPKEVFELMKEPAERSTVVQELLKKISVTEIKPLSLDTLNGLGDSKTDVIQKALELYIQSHGDVNTKRNTVVNTHDQTVNHKVQVTENHELIEYLKRNEEWLKDRIEHFENTQDIILAKTDAKPKKETPISLYRM